MRFLLLLISLFSVISCISKSKTQVHLDPEKVLSYTFELEKKKHKKNPYLAIYKKGNKELYFIASRHLSSVEYPNLLEHPTLKTIKKVFSDYQPEVSIVEGINTGKELSPQSILKHAESCIETQYKKCGESTFTINQAQKNKSHYITGEPTDEFIHRRLLATGFTTEDLLSFYLIRKIPQLIRQGTFSKKTFPKLASELIEKFKTKIGAESNFDFEQFKSWYAQKMPSPKSFYDIKNNDAAPHGGANATYSQKISNKITLIRDQNLVETITEMFSQFDRVLVVYGSSHLVDIEPALKTEFSQIEYKKLY